MKSSRTSRTARIYGLTAGEVADLERAARILIFFGVDDDLAERINKIADGYDRDMEEQK